GAAATAAVAGSPYAIVPSAAIGAGLANYNISYVNGTLTVQAATLTITANSLTKSYGQTVTFAGTEFTSSGLLNGDSVTSVTLTSAGAAATASVAGSPYAIVPSAAVGTGLANYNISYVNGTLTVARADSATSVAAGTTRGTYTATVNPMAPATTTPTGTVQFSIDATPIGGPVTLNGSGQATSSVFDMPETAGSHTISAVYSGDTNYKT